jgi:radical SAM superfamily enzyme YgiQ (UPF0313 family)
VSQKRVRVALVEVPAVDVEMNGARVLDDFTLNHPKYPQLLLAANLRQMADVDLDVTFVDLKAGGDTERVFYETVDYCGRRLDLHRVGVPFDRSADLLVSSDVVGLSANFTFERSMVVQTIQFLRSQHGSPLVIVGGHDATADPEYYLRRGADVCVLGEGETAVQEIVRAVASGGSPAVPGTATLVDGVVRSGRRRPLHRYEEIAFPDADLLRSARFDQSPDGPLPDGVSAPLASFEASRGCPEACTFCDISFIVGRYRPVPYDLLVERIRTFKEAGIRTVQVIDDNLLYRTLSSYDGERGRRTLIDLFEMLYAEGFAWEFFNGFQIGLFERDGRIDRELIDALYRNGRDGDRFVGCFRSYIPLDKVTSGEMALLRKLKPLETAHEVVAAIAETGVPAVALGFVVGSIRETRKSLAETAIRATEFSRGVAAASGGRTAAAVLFLCSVPLPGTPDFRSFQPRIVFAADRYPELYNIFMSVVQNEEFTPLELTLERQQLKRALNPDA